MQILASDPYFEGLDPDGDIITDRDDHLRARLQQFLNVVAPLADALGLTVDDSEGFDIDDLGFPCVRLYVNTDEALIESEAYAPGYIEGFAEAGGTYLSTDEEGVAL